MKRYQQNSRGSALLNAIIVAGVVAGVAGIIMSQTRTTDKMSRNPRIKSAMTVLETQMLSMAMQPGIYQGCSAQAQNCQLNPTAITAFQNMARNVAGANCHTSSSPTGGSPTQGNSSPQSCGVKVQAASSLACLNNQNTGYNANCLAGQFYNAATQTFCAEIVYQGMELAMQPVCASTTVPQSVLQGDSTSCATVANLSGPYPKVIFKGYDGAGNASCAPVPSCAGGNINTPGNYINAIDKLSMQTQCKSLGSLQSCPAGTVLSNLQWMNVGYAFGSISPTANCAPRRVPADIHQVQATTAVTVPPGTYVVVPPPTTTSPTTTVPSSPSTTMPVTDWNCYDGYAGGAGACNTKINIVDDGALSGTNPGSAWIQHTPNIPNGHDNLQCQCSAGIKTPVRCVGNVEYWICAGGSTTLPNCPFPGPTPGDSCSYLGSYAPNGAWICKNSAGVVITTLPCP